MVKIRGKSDTDLRELKAALEVYENDHPGARAELYRQNAASIRVRIVDDHFSNKSRKVRHSEAWKYIESLSEELLQQVTMLILLPEKELQGSMVNMEFEDPVASFL